jgi:hypothetical protein
MSLRPRPPSPASRTKRNNRPGLARISENDLTPCPTPHYYAAFDSKPAIAFCGGRVSLRLSAQMQRRGALQTRDGFAGNKKNLIHCRQGRRLRPRDGRDRVDRGSVR